MIKNIYLKTEPAGEICAGKLDDEQVSLLRELYRKDSMKDSEFGISNAYCFDNIGHTYGLTTVTDGGELDYDGDKMPGYEFHQKITIPVSEESGEYEDGFYLIFTALSKMSIEFEFSPKDGKDFDPKKMTFNVTSVDFEDIVEDSLYGPINYYIIDGYLYNGESIEEASSAELVDRGIDQEVTIIQVKKGKTRLIYKVRNESEEEWGEFLA